MILGFRLLGMVFIISISFFLTFSHLSFLFFFSFFLFSLQSSSVLFGPNFAHPTFIQNPVSMAPRIDKPITTTVLAARFAPRVLRLMDG